MARILVPLLTLVVALVGCGTSPVPTDDEAAVSEISYGDHPDQVLTRYRPGDEVAHRDLTVALFHGGFWRQQYRADLMVPLAVDLAARGYTVVNVEYRRVGGAGGWPATLADVAAAIDALADHAVPQRVVTVGHSAGGHLAVWAASRGSLADGAVGGAPRLHPCAAVAQAGVVDLAGGAAAGLGGGAIDALLGGAPDEVADRYAVADPVQLVPAAGPVLLVHGTADDIVPLAQSEAYVDAARAAGGEVELRPVPGDHFTVIDPSTAAWQEVLGFLERTCRTT